MTYPHHHVSIRTMKNTYHEARLKRIVEEGGKRLNLIISAEANRALARLAADKTETAAVEAAIIKMDRDNNE